MENKLLVDKSGNRQTSECAFTAIKWEMKKDWRRMIEVEEIGNEF